jgi:hypothetical protein
MQGIEVKNVTPPLPPIPINERMTTEEAMRSYQQTLAQSVALPTGQSDGDGEIIDVTPEEIAPAMAMTRRVGHGAQWLHHRFAVESSAISRVRGRRGTTGAAPCPDLATAGPCSSPRAVPRTLRAEHARPRAR